MADRITAACDGASKGNPGPAAWAWVIADSAGEPERWEAGPLGTSTNNIAELTALERLLAATDPAVPMQVRMDSRYAMNAVTTWLSGWKKKGWKTAAGKPVANLDLVVSIEALLAGRSVEFMYVPAHQVDGDRLNAFADRAASQVAVTQQAAGTAHGSEAPAAQSAAPARGGRPRGPGSGRTEGSAGGPQPAKPARTAGTVSAKFPGRCRCGRPYAAGEPISKNPQGWGHPDCRTDGAEQN
jgi:ribonuclease HI